VSVRTHFGVHEKPIEDSEPFGERVMIRRNRAAEIDERRIAVGLREIAEELIVRPILFDDVDDVLERRVLRIDARLTPLICLGNAR
jgi:hypothetical protein